ncbi:MAG: hypothetical protein ACFFD1_03690 [Candidatus Thorarchaeota archaeon]
MDKIDQFEQRLVDKNNKPEVIQVIMNTLHDYKKFLDIKQKSIKEGSTKDFYEFSEKLIDQGKNSFLAFQGLLSFGNFANIPLLSKLGMEVIDGSEVMENFSNRLIEEFGEVLRNEIFIDTNLPELGILPQKKTEYTKILINRLVEKLDVEMCTKFLSKGLRDRYEEFRKPHRKKFVELENIDKFLEWRFNSFIKELEKHRDEGKIFFTQEINDEAVDYVKNNPNRLEGGIRKGNIIYETKVPNEIINYLHTEDDQLKAYYYCHCPWAKESIKDGTSHEIPTVFCNCSGGYYKAYWEIVLEQPVQVELLKSVLKGDSYCQFALTIPSQFIKSQDKVKI